MLERVARGSFSEKVISESRFIRVNRDHHVVRCSDVENVKNKVAMNKDREGTKRRRFVRDKAFDVRHIMLDVPIRYLSRCQISRWTNESGVLQRDVARDTNQHINST